MDFINKISFSDPLFSLIIFLYVSVVFLYMFFAFCWYDQMPVSTFSSSPKPKPKRKVTYKRFVYPYPEEDFPMTAIDAKEAKVR